MINHKAVQKFDKHQASREDGVINLHSVFLFNNQNVRLMCSKELSYLDGYFEHP